MRKPGRRTVPARHPRGLPGAGAGDSLENPDRALRGPHGFHRAGPLGRGMLAAAKEQNACGGALISCTLDPGLFGTNPPEGYTPAEFPKYCTGW